jgi:hypothetical protein
LGCLPKLSMSATVASVAVRRVRASALSGSGSAYTSGDPIIAGSLSLPYTKPPWDEEVSPAGVP